MDREEIKKNIKNTNVWLRIIFMVLFGLFYAVAVSVFWAIVIFQVLYRLITGSVNERVLRFSKGLTLYLYQIFNFMVQITDIKPFPFDEWPYVEDSIVETGKSDS